MSSLDIRAIASPQTEVIPPDFTRTYDVLDWRNAQKGRDRTERRARHIFIFLDGTWNEERTVGGVPTPTNVLRMFHEIDLDPSRETVGSSGQGMRNDVIARYYRGVGSRQDNNAADRLWFGFNGKDEERIRSAAFAGLFCDYKSTDDSIYILGFSRGAASARLLARDICIKGLPPRLQVHTTHFPNLLTGQIEARVDRIDRLNDDGPDIHQKPHYPNVAFLGCWDTVDAFVLPSRFPESGFREKLVRAFKSSIPSLFGWERFGSEENEIPKNVQRAVHCVAIDETRNAFLPTLMPHAPNVEEVWFPGVHSDVGGGYDDNKLAIAPYEFMKSRLLQAVEARGLNPDSLFKRGELSRKAHEYCFHFHGLNTGLGRVKDAFGFGASIRRIRVLRADGDEVRPKIHVSMSRILNSDAVFAADKKNRRTWTITYDPYNVRELHGQFDPVG